MTFMRQWWPTCAAAVIALLAIFVATLTPASAPMVQPLPHPLHISVTHSQTEATAARSLFPSPAMPAAAEGQGQPAVLPTLAGIAWSRTHAVALLSDATSQTTAAHVGDVVRGWTVRAIMPTKVIVANKEEQQELVLPTSQGDASSSHSDRESLKPIRE